MLFPSKHDHPDQTVIAVAAIMMKYLSRKQIAEYDDLLAHCGKRVRHVELLFTPAVDLLFLLGLVRYLPKVDAFEWTALQ